MDKDKNKPLIDEQDGDQVHSTDNAADSEPPSVTYTVEFPDGLNLREGPGLSFDVLEVVPNGAKLTVLPLPGWPEIPGFAWVRYDSGEGDPREGWIDIRYIKED